MSETKETSEPVLDYKKFESLTPLEQRTLIYFRTAPEDSDISAEELEILEEKKVVSDGLKPTLDSLVKKGLLGKGYNPKRQEKFKDGDDRYHLTDVSIHTFLNEELPQIWKEKGLIE